MALFSSRQTPFTVSVPAATEWASYTPTGSWGNTTYVGRWRRQGENIELQVDLSLTGAPTGTLSFTPAQILNGLGLTVNLSNLAGTATSHPIGTFSVNDDGTSQAPGGQVKFDGTTIVLGYSTGATTAQLVNATNPVTFATNDNVSLFVTLPITGWTSHTASTTRADGVTVADIQTVTGAKTFSSLLTASAGASILGASTASNLTLAGSMNMSTAGPSFANRADLPTIGSTHSNVMLGNSAIGGLYNHSGIYFDGSYKHSAANTAAARAVISGQSSLSNNAFTVGSSQSVSHAADSAATIANLLAITHAGAATIGPSGFGGTHTFNGSTSTLGNSSLSGNVLIGSPPTTARLSIKQSANAAVTDGVLIESTTGGNGGFYHDGASLVFREGGVNTLFLDGGTASVAGQLTVGPNASTANNLVLHGSMHMATVGSSFVPRADLPIIGGRTTNIMFGNTGSGAFYAHNGAYFDGSYKHSTANIAAARVVVSGNSSLTGTAFSISSSQSVSHAADSAASLAAIFTVTHQGACTLGPASGDQFVSTNGNKLYSTTVTSTATAFNVVVTPPVNSAFIISAIGTDGRYAQAFVTNANGTFIHTVHANSTITITSSGGSIIVNGNAGGVSVTANALRIM